ncbi:hypothetical protein [Flagellimonas pacifica]|uniref:Uncharacterized protein n=1 Tax=Flagellimonas pacifica TaxID=1247520 RepID=A0A285MVZ0_9FLAO|nr:hypothetical protein [Allomuricauda parva]SNZ01355.1 hypothetical protein SAMN06265377_3193 [Allomuricauda parva]
MKNILLFLLSIISLLTSNQCKSNTDNKETKKSFVQKEQKTTKSENTTCKFSLETLGSNSSNKSRVELIGLYENLNNTGDSTYGYTLSLWELNGQILGFFNLYEGGAEPTRSGAIVNGKRSNDILNIEIWTKGSKAYKDWQQSDTYVFSFSGKLSNNELIGNLSMFNCSSNTLDADYDKEIKLSYSNMWELESFENIKSWKENYSYQLNFKDNK